MPLEKRNDYLDNLFLPKNRPDSRKEPAPHANISITSLSNPMMAQNKPKPIMSLDQAPEHHQ